MIFWLFTQGFHYEYQSFTIQHKTMYYLTLIDCCFLIIITYFIFITHNYKKYWFLFQVASAPILDLVDTFWTIECPSSYHNLNSCNYKIVWSTSQYFDHHYYSLFLPISSFHRRQHTLGRKETLLLSGIMHVISF